jgi:hypothetical protein
MSKNSSTFHRNQIVPPRVRRGGDSAVALWQALSSATMVLPEVLVCLVWEYSFSFIPQGFSLSRFCYFLHLSPGRFARSFGERGSQSGQFNPRAIAATDECVLVIDSLNERCT